MAVFYLSEGPQEVARKVIAETAIRSMGFMRWRFGLNEPARCRHCLKERDGVFIIAENAVP
jgi:hypothetical protein